MQNHFELFGFSPAFTIDALALERSYREIQSRIHPDRYLGAGDAEKRASMQWSTRVNEAYTTLRDPLARARYLLSLRGVEVSSEDRATIRAEFLADQMERMEAIEAAATARSVPALEDLQRAIESERRQREVALAARLDAGDDAQAANLVRELMFLAKQRADVDSAIDSADD